MQTRASLLVRIRDSRAELAWGEVVRLYAPLLHAYAMKNRLQDADAAEVARHEGLPLRLRAFLLEDDGKRPVRLSITHKFRRSFFGSSYGRHPGPSISGSGSASAGVRSLFRAPAIVPPRLVGDCKPVRVQIAVRR